MRKLWQFKARLVRCVDADTVELILDLGFGLYYQEDFRLYGIDAPELHSDAGRAAKEWLENYLEEDRDNLIAHVQKTPKTGKTKKGKYGRYIVTLYKEPKSDLKSVNDELVAIGHAIYKDY